MCVGVPMRVLRVEGHTAWCAAPDRPEEAVSLALTGPVAPGAHVLVYLGSAVQTLGDDEAQRIADALAAVGAAARGEPFEHLIADLIDRKPELPAHLQAAAPRGDVPRAGPHDPDDVEERP